MELQDPILTIALAIIATATLATGKWIISELRAHRRAKALERYRKATDIHQIL